MFNPEESFEENIKEIISVKETKSNKSSKENWFRERVIIENQNDKPKVTAKALNLGEESSILYRVN